MNKSCGAVGICEYQTIGNGFRGCKFEEYCDFQLPRNSVYMTVHDDKLVKEIADLKERVEKLEQSK